MRRGAGVLAARRPLLSLTVIARGPPPGVTASARRKRMIRKFLKDENGVTLIEYGLIAALVGLACVVALTTLGGDLQTSFGNISSSLNP